MFIGTLTLDAIIDPKRNNFGFLRLVAAASVVVSHAFYLGTGNDFAQQWLSGITRYNLAQHAVNVFFFISGLTVAGSLDRTPSLMSFAVARVLRIVPGLVVCIFLTAFLIGPLVSSLSITDYFNNPKTYVNSLKTLVFLKTFTYLPGVFEANFNSSTVNESIWTLKYEVLCYGFLGLIAVIGAWCSRIAFLAVIVLSLLVCIPIVLEPSPPPNTATIIGSAARFWFCFLLGLIFYRYRANLPLSWLALAGLCGLWWTIGVGTILEPIFTFLLTGYGTIMLASCPAGLLRQWTYRHDLSYGIYIYGWPISQTVIWMIPGIDVRLLAAASLLLAGICGWLSWTYIEQPSISARIPLARWFHERRSLVP